MSRNAAVGTLFKAFADTQPAAQSGAQLLVGGVGFG